MAERSSQGDTRRWLGLLALAYALVMAYGSFVPFQFHAYSRHEFGQQLAQMQGLWVIHSRIDFVTNIVLMIPLSSLLLGAWSLGRRRGAVLIGLGGVLPICLAWSLLLEWGQIFFPPRTPSLNDVAAQQVGAWVGCLLWIAVGAQVTQRCRDLWTSRQHAGLASRWLPVYGLVLAIVYLAPLDLAVSPQELWAKWKAGGIQLLPSAALGAEPLERLRSWFGAISYFVPFGFLWTLADPRGGRPLRAAGVGLLVAAFLETAQVFVASRTSSTLEILLAALGTLLGYALATVYRRQRRGPSRNPGLRGAAVAAALVWLGLLVVDHWYPFQFTWDAGRAGQRLSEISWIPLADYVAQPWAHAWDEIVQRISVFAVFGGLGAIACPETMRAANAWVLAGVLGTALVLEAGQAFLPMRSPGFSDVLLELLGGGLGLAVVRQWARASGAASRENVVFAQPERVLG